MAKRDNPPVHESRWVVVRWCKFNDNWTLWLLSESTGKSKRDAHDIARRVRVGGCKGVRVVEIKGVKRKVRKIVSKPKRRKRR